MSTKEKTDEKYLQELREGKHNICCKCGKKGHYASACEEDEQWKQEVKDGCYIFWYCNYCGDEFMEENKYESHKKCCSYIK